MNLRTVYLYKQNMPGETWSVTYSEYVSVALSHPAYKVQYTNCITLSSVACLALLNFSTLYNKRQYFRKNVFSKKVCFGFLYDFAWKTVHSRKNSAIYYDKCPHVFTYSTVILLEFQWQLKFLVDFEKYSNAKCHENTSKGSRIVLCGRTNNPQLTTIFRNFAKEYKNIFSGVLIRNI